MKSVKIECLAQGATLGRQPVSTGVSWPLGAAPAGSHFSLEGIDGTLICVQTRPLNHWPDGSIKWLLCDFWTQVADEDMSTFLLQRTLKVTLDQQDGCKITQQADTWTVDTGTHLFNVDTKTLRPYRTVTCLKTGQVLCQNAAVSVVTADGGESPATVTAVELETTGPVRTTLRLTGAYSLSGGRSLLFIARLHFYTGSGRTKIELRLHNHDAAKHPGNLWDLGDPESIQLKSWQFKVPLAQPLLSARLRVEDSGPWQDVHGFPVDIYQESSGGARWDSPVHRVASGQVPMTLRGWRLQIGGEERQGERAQPQLLLRLTDSCLNATLDKFWQRFPKRLVFNHNQLEFELLPGCFPSLHELQGGEQITEVIHLDFSAAEEQDVSFAPVLLRCAAESVRAARVLPEGLWTPTDPRYRKLLATAMGEAGFIAKREKINEYGWRNFGELYADHEAAFHQGDTPFASHYNNQYDPLYSFYRLFLGGENLTWGEMAGDLAAHLADIDINHTDRDREEYCRGLFWHTDHYLDAGLSTHRMASREHLSHKNPAFCGGGPAAEHCYSGGLALHHLLSGDPRSKQLVIDLANWCWDSLHGPRTIGAATLRWVKNLKKLATVKNSLWPRYPFTRGTGNCLSSTLDAFELSGEWKYLDRAAHLIQGAVHPADNPAERDLLDAELRWSYTVFLSALGRFLAVKKLWQQFDSDFAHARGSLLTYAHWMVDHEYPFLDKPEILEYPNETWAAQDLRKGVVLFYASKYADAVDQEAFRDRAKFFLDYSLDELSRQATSHYTRPLVLLLQNGWAVEAISQEIEEESWSDLPVFSGNQTPKFTFSECCRRFLQDLWTIIPRTGLKRELRWLKSRLPQK